MADGTGFELFPLLMGLFGGLALFLYGLEQLSASLKSVADPPLMWKTLAAGTPRSFQPACTIRVQRSTSSK